MKASDYIAHHLSTQGVTVVYEMIGGMITHILDSLNRNPNFSIVSMHHEQAAGFAAEGWARMKGSPGVALATSGPGATNLVTAIGSCFFDYSPVVFITGQVNTHEMATGKGIRQQGFQETDIVSIVRPITKAAWQVLKAEELPDVMEKAFTIAMTAPRGPVLVDIPMDVQATDIQGVPPPRPLACAPREAGDELRNWAQSFLKDMKEASRPILLAGGGIRSAGAIQELELFVETTHIPVVHSLMGLDGLPYDHPYRVGFIGSYGNRWANKALMEADLVLVLGARLDIRQTSVKTEEFSAGRKIHHVDIEPNQINNRVKGCIGCIADLRVALKVLLQEAEHSIFPDRSTWLQQIHQTRIRWPDTNEVSISSGIHPNAFIHTLSNTFKHASAYVIDVGKNQMWAAQSLDIQTMQRSLFSGGMGSMGFALPAAIGACLAAEKEVVVISGDGGFQCNIQELQTIRHHNLPIKMVVFNNRSLGMVQQFQEDYFEGRLQSTKWGYSAPDFCEVAGGYHIPAMKLIDPRDESTMLQWLRAEKGPALLEVMIDPDLKLFPKTSYGKSLNQMDPGE